MGEAQNAASVERKGFSTNSKVFKNRGKTKPLGRYILLQNGAKMAAERRSVVFHWSRSRRQVLTGELEIYWKSTVATLFALGWHHQLTTTINVQARKLFLNKQLDAVLPNVVPY